MWPSEATLPAMASRPAPGTAALNRLRITAARVVVLAVMLAALVVLAAPPRAHAGSNVYCWGQVFASGADCTGAAHSLRRNYAQNYYGNQSFLEAASALTTSFVQYGSWVYGYGSACHPYSGANVLYPWMYNPDSRTQTMGGVEYWGTESGVC
jgi:hypothetical protein